MNADLGVTTRDVLAGDISTHMCQDTTVERTSYVFIRRAADTMDKRVCIIVDQSGDGLVCPPGHLYFLCSQ
jgi:hypothetical protein